MNTHSYNADTDGNKPLPSLMIDGPDINPKDHVEPGTSTAFLVGAVLALVVLVILTISSMGGILVALLIGLAVQFVLRKQAIAWLKGSAIEVSETQFREVHDCAATIGRRLGMAEVPKIYVIEGNSINALAVKMVNKKVVILIDDAVDACLRSGDPRTLTFILAHELAHHALGHTSLFHGYVAAFMKNLARLNELSCDAVANAVVGDQRISAKALTLLAAGPQLISYVNTQALIVQAQEVAMDKNSKKAERKLSHPLLLRRLSRFV